MKNALLFLILTLAIAGCAGPEKKPSAGLPLKAPAGTPTAAVTAVDAGNNLFAQGQWELAKAQYEAAINAHPTLAEAHYDLALALDRLGRKAEATVHYKEAANLAPGNQVIWNAPPFRQYGVEVQDSLLNKRKPHPDPQRPY